jgi:5-methylcytosine-specific restriction endonuclease McrA
VKRCGKCGETKPLDDFYRDRGNGLTGRTCYCKVCSRLALLARREANPTWQAEYDRRRYAAKRDEILARDRAKYWADPEKARKRVLDWQKRNPEKHADAESRRRARLRAATRVEKIDRLSVYERDGGRCHVCGKKVPKAKFELDHLTPLAKGGEHTYENVRVAHRSCNARRNHGQIPAQLLLVG